MRGAVTETRNVRVVTAMVNSATRGNCIYARTRAMEVRGPQTGERHHCGDGGPSGLKDKKKSPPHTHIGTPEALINGAVGLALDKGGKEPYHSTQLCL